ncbi:MAG: 1-acyl-sn-glycerol-3-phosphate acyltransferase [Acidimicrobiia bacterium]|nr:MAG: 1-acyl-sn-glycerol-3-phosphate acyltransferase [Acidimicrobiia bacterium]
MIRLLGGRLAAGTPREAARLAAGAGWFLGPSARRVCRAGTAGDPPTLHDLERRWAGRVSEFLGIEWDVAGLEHVVRDRRLIVLPLHEGFADGLAVLRLGMDARFVARDELFEWPTLGRYLKATDQVLIDPSAGPAAYRHLLRAGARVLEQNEALVVFPQGSILGVEAAFSRGAFHLAERLDARVLPVVITGSHRVWEYPYSPLVRFGQRVSVRVLPAVPPGEAVERATALEAEMKQVALSDTMAPARRFRPEVDGYWDDYRYAIDPAFPELAARVAAHRESLSR